MRAFCRFATDGNCWQRIGVEICSLVKTRQLAQAETGKILGATQPQVSLLVRNRAGNFSVGRLMEFLTALRQDVEITIRPSRTDHGELSVICD